MSTDIFGNFNNFHRVNSTEEKNYLHPVDKKNIGDENEFIDDEPLKRPVYFFGFILFIGLLILGIQLARIQIVNYAHYRSLASGNSIRVLIVPADRGLILDQKLNPLVRNVNKHALAVNLAELPRNKKDRRKLFQKVEPILHLSEDEIKQIETYFSSGSEEFLLRQNIKRDEMLLLKEKLAQIASFTIIEKPIRQYNSASGLAHLLGYMSRVNEKEVDSGQFLPTESTGRLGLEKVYDNDLRGKMGHITVEVDARGNIIRTLTSPENNNPEPGLNLKLNLDEELQKQVSQFLHQAVEERDKKFGPAPKLGASAVVISPKNGAVLSMVSIPDFDNNLLASGISQDDYQKLNSDESIPMLNRSIQAQFPSGSVIKPVIAAAALNAGTISANYSVDTPASIQIGSFSFPDWTDHGVTDIRRAIAESNNIFFYGLGGGWTGHITGLGMDRMVDYFKRFGFDSPTGVDLTSENDGFVPTPEWKLKTRQEQWYIGDTYHFSIGQGDFLTTPIQLAAAISAIANGGTLYKPKLADALLDQNNNVVKKIEPEIKNKNFVSSQALKIVREGMRQAVLTGSSRRLNTLKVSSAGKTGTAQFGNENRTHAWFASFAPYENPEIVIVVVIEGGGGGHEAALPVAEKILRYYYHDPAPEQPKVEDFQNSTPANNAATNPDNLAPESAEFP